MSLREKLFKFMDEFKEIHDYVWNTSEWTHPFGNYVRHDITNEIRKVASNYNKVYTAKGSVGQTRWTHVPWIAVFDTRITNKATEGKYIVYLLNPTTKELFLTFNQGSGASNSKDLRNALREEAKTIRSIITLPLNVSIDDIDCGNTAYDAGCICSIKYTLESLPDEDVLEKDLEVFLDIYSRYYNEIFIKKSASSTENWWPSLEEFNPNLTKDDWIKYLTEIEIPNHPSPMKMLKGMLDLGGEASCKQLSEIYGGHPTTYIGCAMNMGYRVRQYFDLPECMDGEQKRYFAFPFVGRKDSVSGNYIYKIRPELVEALNEIDLTNIDPDYVSKERLGKFDSWEIIDEKTAIKHCDSSLFKYNSSGVPKGICWFFEAEDLNKSESKEVYLFYNSVKYVGKVTNDSTDRRRIQISWNSDLGKIFKSFEQNDCYAVFNKIDANTYFINIKGGKKEMTIKDTIDHIKSYISSKGFTYEDDLVENFYLSLKSKPFVILAGTSGTGKTRLVKLFAEAIGAKMELVPVRPDWSDSSDLFGHNDIAGNFHPGAVIDFIKEANENKDTPYILCLDEMNLARVEYYLSDFLSIIETRDRKDGEIITDPLIKPTYFKKQEASDKYGQLFLTENLYVVGTVNMDETTFPFSKKVLDRANTIEFSFVNLMSKSTVSEEVFKLTLNNAFLKTEYLYLKDCDNDQLVNDICFTLEEINQILLKANLHVGYRVRDEICFYMMNNAKSELLDSDKAFDNEIMQKILPRIQGSSMSIKETLSELFIKCAGDYTSFNGLTEFEKMSAFIDSNKECKYPNSAKKIAFMMRRYEEDGFTSYWL